MRYSFEDLRGKRVLLVASSGGHLTQLARLAPRWGVDPSSPWVTFDSPQSRSLLADQEVCYVPYIAPRDFRAVARAMRIIRPLLAEVDGAISTGAALALAVLPQLLPQRKPVVYLESVSRVLGPSLTGKAMACLPWVGVYAQHANWLRGPWRQGPSVLAQYRAKTLQPEAPRTMLVLLGTIKPYRFDRLIDTALAYSRRHPEVQITWQVGCTERANLPGRVVQQLPDSELVTSMRTSDLVVAHAGVGLAINILESGRIPILMARDPSLGEHIDGHQQQILDYLTERGLALRADTTLSNDADLHHVVGSRVLRTG